jgi:Protein of unknown function (DUF2924)
MSRLWSNAEREKLANEIATLGAVDEVQLRARWRRVYRTEAPTRFSRGLLMRAIAYRLQERAIGGLKVATRRLFERVAADAQALQPLKLTPELERCAVLIREWGGIQHQVTVL